MFSTVVFTLIVVAEVDNAKEVSEESGDHTDEEEFPEPGIQP